MAHDLAHSAPAAPVRMAHVVLVSTDMPRLVDWYTTVFGCETMHRNDNIAFLTFDRAPSQPTT